MALGNGTLGKKGVESMEMDLRPDTIERVQNRIRSLIAPGLHETMSHYRDESPLVRRTQLEYAHALRGLAVELEAEAERTAPATREYLEDLRERYNRAKARLRT